MTQQPVQWGTITLSLDNETFQKAFSQGREPGISMTASTTTHMLLTT